MTDFWTRVDRSAGPAGCWPWTGGLDADGYGPHRRAFVLARGPVPAGKEIMHRCPGTPNRACCNPAHLVAGTHAENMAQALAEGTLGRNLKVFSEGEVLAMRAARSRDWSARGLAVLFRTHRFTVGHIVRNRRWTLLPMPSASNPPTGLGALLRDQIDAAVAATYTEPILNPRPRGVPRHSRSALPLARLLQVMCANPITVSVED